MNKALFLSIVVCLIFSACKQKRKRAVQLLDPGNFTTLIQEKPVSLYTLESGTGLYMQVTNWGGRVISLWVPDRDGNYDDVVVGYDNIDRYVNNTGERFLGAVVGRYANQIANGQFVQDEHTYQLPCNDNGQTLHGGLKGLDCVVWEIEKIAKNEIMLSYISPDGEEGFPGTLKISMCYSLTPANEFKITYRATTDKPTVINLSHHSFFNLKGEGNGTITDHFLTIHATNIIPINKHLIPTGEIIPVENTPFDFRTPVHIGERIGKEHPQFPSTRLNPNEVYTQTCIYTFAIK